MKRAQEKAWVRVGSLIHFLEKGRMGVRGGRGWVNKGLSGEMLAEWDPEHRFCGQVLNVTNGVRVLPFFLRTTVKLLQDQKLVVPEINGASLFEDPVLEVVGGGVVCLRLQWRVFLHGTNQDVFFDYGVELTSAAFVWSALVPETTHARVEVTPSGVGGVPLGEPAETEVVTSVGINYLPWAVLSGGGAIRHDLNQYDFTYGMGAGLLVVAPPVIEKTLA